LGIGKGRKGLILLTQDQADKRIASELEARSELHPAEIVRR